MLTRSRTLVLILAAFLVVPGVPAARLRPVVLADVPDSQRARLEAVTGDPSVSAHAELAPFTGRSGVFEFLVDHPEFAASVARTLRMARYRIWSTPEGLALDDGWGVTGRFELVYAGTGKRVMHAWGQYRHALLPDIHGQAVVVLDYRVERIAGGSDRLTTAVTGFVKIDSGFLQWATRLASSVATDKANLEAWRLLRVFARVSHAIEEAPESVYAKLRERPDVPREDLAAFARVLNLRPPAAP